MPQKKRAVGSRPPAWRYDQDIDFGSPKAFVAEPEKQAQANSVILVQTQKMLGRIFTDPI
jgi:hypothetical protein